MQNGRACQGQTLILIRNLKNYDTNLKKIAGGSIFLSFHWIIYTTNDIITVIINKAMPILVQVQPKMDLVKWKDLSKTNTHIN